MIEKLPVWIDFTFIITCIITLILFYFSNGKSKKLTILVILWSALHSILAYAGFYQNMYTMPPRFALVIVPPMLILIFGLLPQQQNWIYKTRQTKISTLVHLVRLPVEIVLYGLFINKMIPELMTFEGRNYDIFMGITSPIIGWLFLTHRIGKKILLGWNLLGLFLVLFILLTGILSSELPFQKFGFEQPNRAVIYFPYILLPATIVPIIIWSHISNILKLKNQLKAS